MKTHTNVRRFMKLGAMLLGVCILTAAFATGQQPGRASRPQMAEDVFKNVQVWRAPT
jgi:hypothetical protein